MRLGRSLRASGVMLLAAAAASALPVSAGAAVWNPTITVSPADESAEEPQVAINAHGDVAVSGTTEPSGVTGSTGAAGAIGATSVTSATEPGAGGGQAPAAGNAQTSAAIEPLSVHATAASTGSGAPLSKAQATAFANSVNLTVADVPGFKVEPVHKKKSKTPAEKELGRELSRCVDVAPSKDVVNVKSKEYELETNKQQESVHSSVSIKPTSSLAAKELAVVRGSHARSCLAHYLNVEFKGPQFRGVTVSPVAIKQSTPPASGTTGSFALRITVTITAHGIRVPIYFDLLGFVYGPAQVTLSTGGLAAPFPAATEQRLFSLLLARAKAHANGTLASAAAAHVATLHLTATVYDVHTAKGVSSSKERVYEGTTKLGEDSSKCTEKTSSTVHCIGSYKLTHGTILFSGTISNSSNTNRLKITGGTGTYKGAHGTVLTEYNKAGTRAKETLTFS